MPEVWRRRLGRAGLVLASVVLGVAIVEATLRVLRPVATAIVRQPCIYLEDPELGYRYQPGATGRVHRHFEIDNAVEINALGFHDVERSESPPAGPRILAVGDSQTAAITLATNETWTPDSPPAPPPLPSARPP